MGELHLLPHRIFRKPSSSASLNVFFHQNIFFHPKKKHIYSLALDLLQSRQIYRKPALGLGLGLAEMSRDGSEEYAVTPVTLPVRCTPVSETIQLHLSPPPSCPCSPPNHHQTINSPRPCIQISPAGTSWCSKQDMHLFENRGWMGKRRKGLDRKKDKEKGWEKRLRRNKHLLHEEIHESLSFNPIPSNPFPPPNNPYT